jgi:hypothetical protein
MDSTTTVKLSVDEIRESIVFWLREKKRLEVNPKDIEFSVEGHDRPDDWRAEYALEYELARASFTLKGPHK